MRCDSDLNETRTEPEQSETPADFRVSFESRRARRILVWDEGASNPTLRSFSADGLSDEEYLAALHRMADEFDADTYCYFIGGETGPVKIGMAANVERRFRDIQACSPITLKVLAQTHGGQSRETAYHFTFRRHRLHGEWFERCPEIEAEIERLKRG